MSTPSVINPSKYTMVVGTPGLVAEDRILQVGDFLCHANFRLRATSIFLGNRHLMGLLYPKPQKSVQERLDRIPSAFLSYSEYEGSYFFIALLESLDESPEGAHLRLQALKGASKPHLSQAGTIRGLSHLTIHRYSYVHVPDEHELQNLYEWAFVPLEKLIQNTSHNEDRWAILRKTLLPLPGLADLSPALLLDHILDRCVDQLWLSGLDGVDSLVQSWLAQKPHLGCGYEWPQAIPSTYRYLKEAITPLKRCLPETTFTGRRLSLIVQCILWLITPTDWNIINVAEFKSLLAYAGVPLHGAHLQALLAWMVHG